MRPTSVAVLIAALLSAVAAPAIHAQGISVVTERDLPGLPGNPHDIRWSSVDRVALSLGKSGAVTVAVGGIQAKSETLIPAATNGGFFFSSRLALSPQWALVASPFGGLSWRNLASGAMAPKPFPLAVVVDVDIRGDRAAILGGDRGENGDWSPDGAIAWTGSLSRNLSDLRPLMVAAQKSGAMAMARCHFLESGAIRFMQDGSVVTMPGVEPDIYQYDAAGRLLRTWPTGPLGVLDYCPFDDVQTSEMAADPVRRMNWINQRTIVDDILPLDSGPALLLRAVKGNKTTWSVAVLRSNGSVQKIPLSVTAQTPGAHMRGDVRGDRIALLVLDYALPGHRPATPRLVLAKVTR